ncbi:MAG: VanZ family protein [Anaerolineales bacterium]|nr:VanZ family protein [Anaerolineales bacterium]
MKKFLLIVPRWFPAFLMMTVIFIFSSRSGDDLPNFLGWDYFVKKGGHMVGYGILALSYFHLLKEGKNRYWLAWIMAVIFSATDEFHQSFVPGRSSSVFDVLIFDNFGAILGLSLYYFYQSKHKKENHSP